MTKPKHVAPHAEPVVAPDAPIVPAEHPAQAADAGAAFQHDRSGSPRGRELTEGQANFAAFSQSIRDAQAPKEAA